MRLNAIELRHVGVFDGGISVGPFAEGLNILSAPNEAGKSTLLWATARGLFDRHTLSGEAATRLQPVGASLAPEITVIFTAGGGRYRIRKRFLHGPLSELSEHDGGSWRVVADGDRADDRVLELVGGSRPGRGATKATHWGLLRYLWGRQGESAEWPVWDDVGGARIRSELARVELDPLVERLRARLEETHAEQLTATGRVARQSGLYEARARVARLEEEMASVRAALDRLEHQERELRSCAEERAVRRRERAAAEDRAEQLTTALSELELLRKDLERWGQARESARERLNEVDRDRRELETLERDAGEADRRAREEARAAEEGRDQLEAARRGLADALARQRELQQRLAGARHEEARLRDGRELLDCRARVESLRARWGEVEGLVQRREECTRRRTAWPGITAEDLEALRAARQRERELETEARAYGLRLRLRPDKTARMQVSRDGHTEEVEAPGGRETALSAGRTVRLALSGWGTLDIHAGAPEAGDVERQLEETRTWIAGRLRELGVLSVDEGALRLEQVKDLDRERRAIDAQLESVVRDWASPAEMHAELLRAEAELAQRMQRCGVTTPRAAPASAALEAELSRIQSALRLDEAAEAEQRNAIAARQARIEQAEKAAAEADRRAVEQATACAALTAKLEALRTRYPDGIDAAQAAARETFVTAEARLEAARGRLPSDWETLAERQQRALAASLQAAQEDHAIEQRMQRLEGALAQAGAEGLYSRETALTEALAPAQTEAERIERTATAARLAGALIDYRQRAAVRTVLRPLEDQLSAAFAELSGNHDRRVFLDERLQVRGVGTAPDRCLAFDQLSQGAREQLLLALRAAAALELARHEPQLLILDDVLVHTDPVRQERVLDFLTRLAEEVQVLVLTCHPDRYRGVGTALPWEGVPARTE